MIEEPIKALPYSLPLEVDVAGDFSFFLICMIAGPFFLAFPVLAPYLGIEPVSRGVALDYLLFFLGLFFCGFLFIKKF